ncbi:MAG TPA: hypothetical protein PL100_07995 [Bacillota bacterium]|nr:hypothetical protein [Bacillota bacterium]HQC49435.1 hypothetical protein [Bacillota bacterium]
MKKRIMLSALAFVLVIAMASAIACTKSNGKNGIDPSYNIDAPIPSQEIIESGFEKKGIVSAETKLKIGTYALDEKPRGIDKPDINMKLGEKIVCGDPHAPTSLIPGIPLFFRGYLTTYEFKLSVDYGTLNRWDVGAPDSILQSLGKEYFTRSKNGMILWAPEDEPPAEPMTTPFRVIVYSDESYKQIVGAALIMLSYDEGGWSMKWVKGVEFPKVDGAFQKIYETDLMDFFKP